MLRPPRLTGMCGGRILHRRRSSFFSVCACELLESRWLNLLDYTKADISLQCHRQVGNLIYLASRVNSRSSQPCRGGISDRANCVDDRPAAIIAPAELQSDHSTCP